MNNKDIARSIAEKHQLKISEASDFLSRMVDVVNDGLHYEKQVKLRGLGTFKVTSVNSRESVDVNTGERIVIDGRNKISFIPDNQMKERVNAPFSQFETVILNDGVDFDDEPKDKIPEETETDLQKTIVQQEVILKEPETDSDLDDCLPENTEKPKEVDKLKEIEEPDISGNNNSHKIIGLLIAAVCILTVVCGATVFYMLSELNKRDNRIEHLVTQIQQSKNAKVKVNAIKKTTVKADTANVAAELATKTIIQEQPKAEPVENKEDKFAAANNSDPRIRTGAYQIIGIAKTVTVKQGQTVSSISRTNLGPDMECYVEAVNESREIKAGDKVNIPELKLKKHIR